jgi:hypothetical protein
MQLLSGMRALTSLCISSHHRYLMLAPLGTRFEALAAAPALERLTLTDVQSCTPQSIESLVPTLDSALPRLRCVKLIVNYAWFHPPVRDAVRELQTRALRIEVEAVFPPPGPYFDDV